MSLESSSALYTFLGTAFTGVLALAVLVINQFFEIKKASLSRQFVELDAAKKDKALENIDHLVNSQLSVAINKISELTNEIGELQKTIYGLISTPDSDDIIADAQMKLGKANSKRDAAIEVVKSVEVKSVEVNPVDSPVVESVPVILEAKVEIGELATLESGDVKLKKVEKAK